MDKDILDAEVKRIVGIREKRHNMIMDQYGDIIAGHRTVLYAETDRLEATVKALLDARSSAKITEEIYFSPLKGLARTMKVRVVHFNNRIRLNDPNGTVAEPDFYCKALVKMPADRSAKMPAEWFLEDLVTGDQVSMHDLSMDDLLLLSDRLFDKDCSLDIHWNEEVNI